MNEVDNFLAHYGVPGMKWGKRKAQDSEDKPTRLSRKEVRLVNKEGQQKFYEDKATRIFAESLKKGEKILVETMMAGDYVPTIMTGKQFADHALSGGVFNIKTTEVFARKEGKQYVLNEDRGHQYQKVKR